MSKTFQRGDLAQQAFNTVRVITPERKYGQDGYRVERTKAEPHGYNKDGSIYSTVGLPFWVPAHLLSEIVNRSCAACGAQYDRPGRTCSGRCEWTLREQEREAVA